MYWHLFSFWLTPWIFGHFGCNVNRVFHLLFAEMPRLGYIVFESLSLLKAYNCLVFEVTRGTVHSVRNKTTFFFDWSIFVSPIFGAIISLWENFFTFEWKIHNNRSIPLIYDHYIQIFPNHFIESKWQANWWWGGSKHSTDLSLFRQNIYTHRMHSI